MWRINFSNFVEHVTMAKVKLLQTVIISYVSILIDFPYFKFQQMGFKAPAKPTPEGDDPPEEEQEEVCIILFK